jgi:threonine synthase
VPTGNFGDIFAGYVAMQMGAPIQRLVLATNENDILSRFFRDGVYEKGQVQPTLSPSMDIQVASNFERYLYYRLDQDPERVRGAMARFAREGRLDVPGADPGFVAGCGTRADTLAAIREYWTRFRYLPDPHTAVGLHVAQEYLCERFPMVCLATAHPAKFGEAVTEALGENLAHHEMIDALEGRETRCVVLPATKDAVQAHIEQTLAAVST